MAETNGKRRAAAGAAPHRTHWAIFAVLAALVAVLSATGMFFVRSLEREESERLAENDAIARGVAAFIEARHQGHLNVLLAYAGRFKFREMVKQKDRAQAMIHLRQLAESFPELDRPFLTDPAGVLWAIYPEAPQSLGRSFADRDWYRGVSREWRPYVSDVYAQYRDQAIAVAVAMPIRDLDGTVIGILVSPQRLEVIRRWLLPITVPNGDLYIVDRKGRLVFHRTRTGPDSLLDYAQVPVVQRLLRGEEGVAGTETPVEGQVRLTASRLLRPLGWGLVVHREKNLVLQQMRALIVISAGAGFFLTVALATLATIALRNQRQTVAALAALAEKTRALKEAQEELVRKERLAILGELAGGVSHELRNPLGVIKNSVYYLKMVLPAEEERARKHLQILEREVATANRIVGELLDFARVTPPNRGPADLNRVVQEILEEAPLGGKIKLVTELALDLPAVVVDPDQIKQVLGNLVSNAVQAMPEGGTLTIETARADGGAVATVSDTGVGIPPEQIGKIFEPLFTTKAKGIGLGLAIAKSLAEANGATISVESEPGRGSRFTVRFTRSREEG